MCHVLIPGWTKHWNIGFIYPSSTVTKLLSRKLLPSEGCWWRLTELMMWKSHLRWVCKKTQQNGITMIKKTTQTSFSSPLSCFFSPFQELLRWIPALMPGVLNLCICHSAAEKWILLFLTLFLEWLWELPANWVSFGPWHETQSSIRIHRGFAKDVIVITIIIITFNTTSGASELMFGVLL